MNRSHGAGDGGLPRHWFLCCRPYDPLETYFDRFWKLGDITPA